MLGVLAGRVRAALLAARVLGASRLLLWLWPHTRLLTLGVVLSKQLPLVQALALEHLQLGGIRLRVREVGHVQARQGIGQAQQILVAEERPTHHLLVLRDDHEAAVRGTIDVVLQCSLVVADADLLQGIVHELDLCQVHQRKHLDIARHQEHHEAVVALPVDDVGRDGVVGAGEGGVERIGGQRVDANLLGRAHQQVLLVLLRERRLRSLLRGVLALVVEVPDNHLLVRLTEPLLLLPFLSCPLFGAFPGRGIRRDCCAGAVQH
mmetsp:Transcript_5923/g.23332  ORF Transcript_5923/g.23332 Transcript_5923/m.23332 type:complete len:264 (-) Transcript_5923:725-1516(-)